MVEVNSHAIFVDDANPAFMARLPHCLKDFDAQSLEALMEKRLTRVGVARPELRLLWQAPCMVDIYRFDVGYWRGHYGLSLHDLAPQPKGGQSVKDRLKLEDQVIWLSLVRDDEASRVIYQTSSPDKPCTVEEHSEKMGAKFLKERNAVLLWGLRPIPGASSDALHHSVLAGMCRNMTQWVAAMDAIRCD